jgi:hypothetical protein
MLKNKKERNDKTAETMVSVLLFGQKVWLQFNQISGFG